MLLDNNSNKFAQLYFDKIQNSKTIELKTKKYLSYGYMFISVVDAENLNFYYNSQLIAKFNNVQSSFIPLVFEMDSQIKIVGNCGKLKLVIYGAEIKNCAKQYLFPSENYIVKDNGDMCIYKYSSIEDILNGDLTTIKQIQNCLDIELFLLNGNKCLLYVVNKDNGTYLYGTNDNYTNGILIESDITDAKIVDRGVGDELIVVYIKDDKLFYKILNIESGQFNSEVEIVLAKNIVPRSFGQIQYEVLTQNGFLGVHYSDNSYRLFKFIDGKFVELLTKRAVFSKVSVDSDSAVVFCMDGYEVEYSKYTIVSGKDLLQDGLIKNLFNINDILKVGDKYVGIINGEYREISL